MSYMANISPVLLFLIIHILGDFYFQTDRIAHDLYSITAYLLLF